MLSSIGWIFEGEAIARLAPVPVICLASLLGGACLLSLGACTGKRSLKEILPYITLSFLIFSVFRSGILSLLFGYCLTLTSSTKAMFLTKIEPYIVLLIQILFHGHRTTPAHLLLLGAHLAGAVVLSTGGSLVLSTDRWGDILILVAVTGNAALYGPSQRYAQQMGAFYASGSSQLLGGIALTPLLLATPIHSFVGAPEHLVGWYYTLATVVVFYILSTGLWFFSLKEVPAWLASALRCVGPIIAAPIAWLVFGQGLTPLQSLGGLVVVGTSLWMIILERGRPASRSVTADNSPRSSIKHVTTEVSSTDQGEDRS
jgi:probable blue pigment (indigoidine) exporter